MSSQFTYWRFVKEKGDLLSTLKGKALHNGPQTDEYDSWKTPKEVDLRLMDHQHFLAGSWLVHQRLNIGGSIL